MRTVFYREINYQKLLIAILFVVAILLFAIHLIKCKKHDEQFRNFRLNFAKTAHSYIGVKEAEHENRGVEIDFWNKEIGLPVGQPWCLSAIQSWAKSAAIQMGMSDPLIPDTGNVMKLWKGVPKNWKIGIDQGGTTGDIMVFDKGWGRGHCGVVWKKQGNHYVTIEANTDPAGSRDGYIVALRQRAINEPDMIGFIRIR